MVGKPFTEEKRLAAFWRKVEVLGPNDCWMWRGARDNNGYGVVTLVSRPHKGVASHRFAYEAQVGPIPVGLQIDHLCRNRLCQNARHLEPVTQKVNLLRGEGWGAQAARKTECPSGHPYDEVNTRWYQGRRYCRACHAARGKRRSLDG